SKIEALYELARYEECNKVSNDALSLDPDNKQANYYKGMALIGLNKKFDAEKFLSKSDGKDEEKSLRVGKPSIADVAPI
ncbi:MAG TPA: hypothetical protein VLA74_12785, partial [Nitrososphaeraceae archaeon]|nr:hypothetical protein [Nitrososphaeraceae archaeon]